MRETKFIEQNQEKWAEFEEMLRAEKTDPDRLNDLYIQITDDLSFARTFYPNRSVRFYLNSLAQRIFHNIYRGRQFPKSRFRTFWTDDIPQVMWEARRTLLISFAIFVFAMLVGVVSSRIDPDFARLILGDNYVEMTIRNIEAGDPMAVYKDRDAFGMSLGIAFNNIFVALLTAVLGVIACFGTVFLLLSNGVMVGAFQYFFVEKGLFWESFLTIWIHGTLEISAIIIAGAAGLTAGSGLLFPGTFTRIQAFQMSVRRGMKIFIGLIPVFALAAFFEGFLTRFTETPDLIRALFILTSLGFVLWYFVWLPSEKAKKGFPNASKETELPPDRDDAIDFSSLKTSGEIFSDAITLLKRSPKPLAIGLFSATTIFMLSVSWFMPNGLSGSFNFRGWGLGVLSGAADFFNSGDFRWMFFLQIGLLAGLAMLAFRTVERELPAQMLRPTNRLRWIFAFAMLALPAAASVLVFKIVDEPSLCWLAMILTLCFCSLIASIIYFEDANPFAAILRAIQLMRWKIGALVGFIIVDLALVLFFFFDSEVFSILIEMLSWNVRSGEDNVRSFASIFTTFAASMGVYFIWWLAMLSGAMQFFAFREMQDATSLFEKIKQVGQVRQIRGLARE